MAHTKASNVCGACISRQKYRKTRSVEDSLSYTFRKQVSTYRSLHAIVELEAIPVRNSPSVNICVLKAAVLKRVRLVRVCRVKKRRFTILELVSYLYISDVQLDPG